MKMCYINKIFFGTIFFLNYWCTFNFFLMPHWYRLTVPSSTHQLMRSWSTAALFAPVKFNLYHRKRILRVPYFTEAKEKCISDFYSSLSLNCFYWINYSLSVLETAAVSFCDTFWLFSGRVKQGPPRHKLQKPSLHRASQTLNWSGWYKPEASFTVKRMLLLFHTTKQKYDLRPVRKDERENYCCILIMWVC